TLGLIAPRTGETKSVNQSETRPLLLKAKMSSICRLFGRYPDVAGRCCIRTTETRVLMLTRTHRCCSGAKKHTFPAHREPNQTRSSLKSGLSVEVRTTSPT